MKAAFNRIMIKSKVGGSSKTDGMMREFLDVHYQQAKQIYDESSESEKQEFKTAMNNFKSGLGDSFQSGLDKFEIEALGIMEHEAFFELLAGFGFDVQF